MEKKKLKSYRKSNNIGWFKYYLSRDKNVFIYSIECIKAFFSAKPPFIELGTHFISGYPGAGKTLLMNHIINSVNKDDYFFYTNIDEFNQENVYKIDLDVLFKDKEQQFKLKTKIGKRRLFGLILDEVNFNFNKRVNMSKDYTNVFIPLVNMIISHRHQNIPRVYFIGQKLELQDTQLVSLFKYQHDIIRTKRRRRYWVYYKSGFVPKIPVKLKVINRVKDNTDVFVDVSKNKVKISWFDLETYDTFGLKKMFDNLKEYPIK